MPAVPKTKLPKRRQGCAPTRSTVSRSREVLKFACLISPPFTGQFRLSATSPRREICSSEDSTGRPRIFLALKIAKATLPPRS